MTERCPTCGSDDRSLFLGRCQDEVDRVADLGGAIVAAKWHVSQPPPGETTQEQGDRA